MSRPRPAHAVKLVASIFSADWSDIGAAIDTLTVRFGKPDFVSAGMPFAETDYYEEEMGKLLVRRMVSFGPLIRPEALPEIKCLTNRMEALHEQGDQRRVNIDPGYLSPSHLILATGKGYSHRPYLRDGIYADLTLIFSDGTFRPLPWTYPDYAGRQMIGLLNRVREKYLLDLKNAAGGSGRMKTDARRVENMIRSMTGYGRAEGFLGGRKYIVEVKSLNHRYLELSLRMPANLAPLELEVKKKINEQLVRGRIDVTIRRENQAGTEEARPLEMNLSLVKNYHDLLTRLKEQFGLTDEITLDMLTGLKDVFVPVELPEDDVNTIWEGLAVVLNEALEALTMMRQKEGAALREDLESRIALIDGYLGEIEACVPRNVQEYQRRLADRVRELLDGMPVDEARLCQEVAIMAEKSDITEEIVRFRSHIGQFLEMLKSREAVGRKVDFLIQEMNREVNTIGSKSSDAQISRHVIEIKSELSKLREQVQNIE